MSYFSFILGIILLALVVIGFKRRFENSPVASLYYPALALKVMSGITLGIIYFYFYQVGDTLVYFSDASVLSHWAVEQPGSYFKYLIYSEAPSNILNQLTYLSSVPRAQWLVKVASFFNLLSGNNYYLLATWFSVFSFCGSFYLAHVLVSVKRELKMAAVISLLFFPSVVFWSSGLTKESIAVASIMFLIGIAINWTTKRELNVINVVLGVIFLYLLWTVKYYYAAILVPILMTFLIANEVKVRFPSRKYWPLIVWIFTLGFGVLVATFTKEMLSLEILPPLIFDNYLQFTQKSMNGDALIFPYLDGTWVGIIKSVPAAILNGIFRPLFWEANSFFKGVIAIENTFLLVLFLFNLKNIYRSLRERTLWLYSSGAYIIVLSAFLAMSTPNFGTLSRYKAGWLFLFTFIILQDNPLLQYVKRWSHKMNKDE